MECIFLTTACEILSNLWCCGKNLVDCMQIHLVGLFDIWVLYLLVFRPIEFSLSVIPPKGFGLLFFDQSNLTHMNNIWYTNQNQLWKIITKNHSIIFVICVSCWVDAPFASHNTYLEFILLALHNFTVLGKFNWEFPTFSIGSFQLALLI